MNYCRLCEKKLVPVGRSRSNGKNHNDWNSREFHKCCYRLIYNLPEEQRRRWLGY